LAYVVSMAQSLHSFVYREVRELRGTGVSVHLFPTKVGPGPYEPPSSWPVHRASMFAAVSAHIRCLTRDPIRYLKAVREALIAGALVDYSLGAVLADLVNRHNMQLVHCHFGDHKFFIGYFAGQLSRKPVTVTIHAYELYNNPNFRMFRRALGTVAAIVTVSDYNRRILEQQYGVSPERIHVIPMFADIPNSPVLSAPPNDRIIVLTVARLVEKKGHGTLIRALAKLPANYEAWVVGTGPLDVRSIAKAAKVGDRVKVLGRLSDEQLQKTYQAATIFCLPSETSAEGDREGIPVALMEAMAHGLPVVATRHAGIPELVSEVLVEQGDVEGLAAALLQLGQNLDLRYRQGRKNREIVSARFSRRNVLLLKALFERTVAKDSEAATPTEVLAHA
jgi:colanic acid/amylovoran biosynthesis glycosyltransferase